MYIKSDIKRRDVKVLVLNCNLALMEKSEELSSEKVKKNLKKTSSEEDLLY